MKVSGLGDNAYVGGYDLSGNVSALSVIRGGPALLDVTSIDGSAYSRIGGLRDGEISFASWFDTAALREHVILSTLPTADTQVMYFRGTTLGNPVAAIRAKQINYDGARAQDGSLAFQVQALGSGFGLDWGNSLTAGKRVDTVASNGASIDDLAGSPASTAFGWAAYLQVFAFTGTSCTVSLEDSANDTVWAALAGSGFVAATGITHERIQAGTSTATVRRYIRAVTTGTFSSATFAVAIVRYTTAVL